MSISKVIMMTYQFVKIGVLNYHFCNSERVHEKIGCDRSYKYDIIEVIKTGRIVQTPTSHLQAINGLTYYVTNILTLYTPSYSGLSSGVVRKCKTFEFWAFNSMLTSRAVISYYPAISQFQLKYTQHHDSPSLVKFIVDQYDLGNNAIINNTDMCLLNRDCVLAIGAS